MNSEEGGCLLITPPITSTRIKFSSRLGDRIKAARAKLGGKKITTEYQQKKTHIDDREIVRVGGGGHPERVGPVLALEVGQERPRPLVTLVSFCFVLSRPDARIVRVRRRCGVRAEGIKHWAR